MTEKHESQNNDAENHRMPDNSVFFDRVVPVLFIILAVVMIVLIALAIGVLTGTVSWT